MKDVARAAGVHVTTVSLALRNSPQLPEHTRERIQTLARDMGYRTNPLVAAFVQQRRIGALARFQGVLGFVTHSGPARTFPGNPYVSRIFDAATEHARVFGYRMEVIEVADFGYDPARVERVLHARNIRGLMFPPSDKLGAEIIPFNWENFATITLSTSIQKPTMDRVDTDHFGGALLAVQQLKANGYKRPGYVSLASTDMRTQGRWRGGFLAETQRLNIKSDVPPLVAQDERMSKEFGRWYKRWRPDVLVSIGFAYETCLPVLQAMGVSIPQDVSLVDLNIHTKRGRHTGIYTGIEMAARIAVDHLISKLQRNVLGLPEYPQVLLHPAIWHDGETLPRVATHRRPRLA
jgi:LacI family transcriptional regulator